jgi:cytochrome d ubiquinol oxidase subunit II
VLFAFLAATYLTVESAGALKDDFRRRAFMAGIAAGLLALAVYVLAGEGAPRVREGLTRRPWSWPLQIATAIAAIAALVALWRRSYGVARLAAAAQVALIVIGWAASQYPWLVVPSLTLQSASAPQDTQVLLLIVVACGAVLLFPCLYLLFRVFKGDRPFRARLTRGGRTGAAP